MLEIGRRHPGAKISLGRRMVDAAVMPGVRRVHIRISGVGCISAQHPCYVFPIHKGTVSIEVDVVGVCPFLVIGPEVIIATEQESRIGLADVRTLFQPALPFPFISLHRVFQNLAGDLHTMQDSVAKRYCAGVLFLAAPGRPPAAPGQSSAPVRLRKDVGGVGG